VFGVIRCHKDRENKPKPTLAGEGKIHFLVDHRSLAISTSPSPAPAPAAPPAAPPAPAPAPAPAPPPAAAAAAAAVAVAPAAAPAAAPNPMSGLSSSLSQSLPLSVPRTSVTGALFGTRALTRRTFHSTLPAPYLAPLAVGFAIGIGAVSLKFMLDMAKRGSAPASSPAEGDAPPAATTKRGGSSQSAAAAGAGATGSAARLKLGDVIGIDFGVFNTRVAVPLVEADGKLKGIKVVENADGARMTPSIVGVQGTQILTGASARRQLYTNPSHTLFGLRLLLGRKLSDPLAQRVLKMNKVDFRDDGNGGIVLNIGGVSLTPEEATAKVFEAMRKSAESSLGRKVRGSSLSVASNATPEERAALASASTMAGLEPILVSNEAVSGLYGGEFGATSDLEGGLDDRVLVFDSGEHHFPLYFSCNPLTFVSFFRPGSSTRVSILEREGDGVFNVKASLQDQPLSGLVFEEQLLMSLVVKFAKEKNIDLLRDILSEQRLRETAEKAKAELSSTVKTNVNLPYITADAKGPMVSFSTPLLFCFLFFCFCFRFDQETNLSNYST